MTESMRSASRHVVMGVAIVAATALMLATLLTITGHASLDALAAFVRGSLTPSTFASATLVRATPLMLAGLAVAVAFTAGVWNIGAEGQLLAGAAAAAALALWGAPALGGMTLPLAIAAGAAAGLGWALVAAALRRWLGVLEVISTIMLNFIALHLVGLLVRGPLQEPLGIYPQSATLPPEAIIPRIPGLGRLHWGIVLALLACATVWVVYRRTAGGFRARAVGANPRVAAIAGGIPVGQVAFRAFLVSGALAGLAGAIELTGVSFALYESLSPGYGYVAIAVALLARLHPLGVVGAALLFGALEAGGAAMQRDAGVPAALVTTVEALLVIAVITWPALSRPARRREMGPLLPAA